MIQDEQPNVYNIPENFIDESRIIKGLFKTRNFIEGALMALFVALFAWFIPIENINIRLFAIVALCMPFFLIGYHGFNGDPFSVAVSNAYSWLQNRGVMLYNSRTQALAKAPLDAMMESEVLQDKLVDAWDTAIENRRRRMAAKPLIEGETFEFADDEELFGIYADSKQMKGVGVYDINEPASLLSVGHLQREKNRKE
ncbi:hypothetical protein ACLGL1_07030 [Peptococcus simiae]|uniref:hypothetical protein n=1 Tax=Peptococcus simiae TaxID=1643805 RepID=UPI0039809130